MNIGCHISIAGGIPNAPERAADLGCEVMQIFTRSPQGGKAAILTNEICEEFKLKAKSYKLKAWYVHAPYYINFASANNRIRYGSVSVIRDELERGSLLSAKYVMTHLGSAKELGQEKSFEKVCEMLQKSLEGYTGSTKLLLENSAGSGEIIGDSLSELSEILKKVKSKAIAGICLDTQHSFVSGYDWTDFEVAREKIDKEIGWKNVKLIHANDSQTEMNSRKDRHEHIGKGKIGLAAFKKIVALAEERGIDMICETQLPDVAEDIKTLKKLRG